MRYLIAFAVLMLAAPFAPAAGKSPDTAPATQPGLPLIGNALGGPPAGLGKVVYSVRKDRAKVKELTGGEAGRMADDWYSPGLAGAKYAAATEQDGKIVRVMLFYFDLNAKKAKSLLAEIEKAGEPEKAENTYTMKGPDGAPVVVYVSGMDDSGKPRDVVVSFTLQPAPPKGKK